MENTYNLVKEDNEQAAAERMSGVFGQVKTYIRNEADNNSRLDHLAITRPMPSMISFGPVFATVSASTASTLPT